MNFGTMQLIAINVGRVVPLSIPSDRQTGSRAQEVKSGIRKSPVSTAEHPDAVKIGSAGVEGDEQADPKVHGGWDKAVYAYPIEHYPVWQTMRGQALQQSELVLPYGTFGENLSVSGLLESEVWIGDVLGFAQSEVRLRVTAPRSPCFKFNAVMGFSQASALMNQSGYTGFYLEVLQPGMLCAGDAITLMPGDRRVSVEEMHRVNVRRA